MAPGIDSPSTVIPQPSADASRLFLSRRRLIGGAGWLVALALLVSAALAASRWLGRDAIAVTVAVDDGIETVHSRRATVGALLDDLGLQVGADDILDPAPDTVLAPGLSVSLRRARAYLLQADGALRRISSQARTVGDLFSEAGVRLSPGDQVLLEGDLVDADTPLRTADVGCAECASLTFARPRAWSDKDVPPLRLELRRAVPLRIDDGSVPFTIHTTATTVGEALLREGVLLYLGDTVQPSLGSPVRADMRVAIKRSKSLLITADGRTVRTRTQRDTVGNSLVDLGIFVAGRDRITPSLEEHVVDNMQIRVVRVLETVEVERKLISYESVMAPDDQIEIDQQRVSQAGQDGEFRRRFKVEYEDGVETWRNVVDEWVAAEPITRVVSYGRQIVSRPLETADGTLNYWRKIQMYATAYSPARSGTPRSAPWYGRTRTGQQLRKGLVAVDPNVIPLGTRLYVPGYGVAVASDTGGGVRGRMIDLGYEDSDYQSWHWWVDVYVLDPPPASTAITWVLPKYPEGRFPFRRN
jgi:resuscitation-promoting factor RpfB